MVVGAILCDPVDPSSAAGVIYFNNIGYLGMCGHGTIGLMVTLAYMGRIAPGRHFIETPVGTVSAVLHENSQVTVNNVELGLRAAIDGLGIAFTPEAFAEPFLRSGQLVRVLEDWSPTIEGLFLYYTGRRQVPAALRALIDMIRESRAPAKALLENPPS